MARKAEETGAAPDVRRIVEKIVSDLLDADEVPVLIVAARADGTASVTTNPGMKNEVARAVLLEASRYLDGRAPDSIISAPEEDPSSGES